MELLKKAFLILALLVSVVELAVADELNDKCAEIYDENPPKVLITYNYGQLKYDNSKTKEELGEMYKQISSGQPSKSIHGLTYLEPNVTTKVSIDASILDKNTVCFYPQKIEIKVWYDPTVYIANSLKQGTCRFNTTVRHEQTHLDLGHHALYMFAKSLREAESEILSSTAPIVENMSSVDGDKIVKDITDSYHETVKIYFEKFKDNLDKYNYVIDTPENYADETKLCKAE